MLWDLFSSAQGVPKVIYLIRSRCPDKLTIRKRAEPTLRKEICSLASPRWLGKDWWREG